MNKELMNQKLLHWYEMVKRPISPGCQPKGFNKFDDSRGKHGIIAYNRMLTDYELDEYEMREWKVKDRCLKYSPMWKDGNVLYHYNDKQRASETARLKYVVMDRDYFIGTWQLEENFAVAICDSEQKAEEFILL